MKESLAVGLLFGLLGTAVPAKALEQPSRFDLYGGYYYARINVNANVPGIAPAATYIGEGGGGQLKYNAKNWLAVVGDLSGFYATSAGNGAFAGAFLTYMAGPRVNFRHGKFTPFVQALFGGVRTTDGIAQSTGTENNFAMATGGGVDFKLSKRVSLRPIQAEYFMTKIPDGLNNRQDNLRIGAGIVLHLGGT